MKGGSPSSSPYTRLASGVLFPLHERIKGHESLALRRELEASQWFERQRIEQLQLDRLRGFLRQVGEDVPYFRDTFAAVGFDPASVHSVRDLSRLPFLTKSLIRLNPEAMKARSAQHLVRYNTGGSTGEPLVFWIGRDRVSHDVAAKWRATRWWGVDIGDPEVVLWGSPVELGKQDHLKALRDKIFRSRLLPAFQMSTSQMDRYLLDLERRPPKMVFGYASAIALLARHANARQVDLRRLGVRVAFVTGETLYPDQRDVIHRVFGCPVANGYGSRDAGFIAHECPAGSLHVSMEHIVVELVDASGHAVRPGEVGEMVVTHLATAEFPFIRYRTGDMAVMGQAACACGRGLPVLDSVFGRSTDFIRTPSGNVMHALGLIYEVRDTPGVVAFKFIQARDLSLELLLVAGPELTAVAEDEIRRGVMARMGPGALLAIRRVGEIAPEKSGKYRYVVSYAEG